MKLHRVGIIVLAALLPSPGIAHATSIDITGISPNWSITAGGAIDVAPLHVMGNGFSITSNNVSTGTPVAGLNLATFDGWWAAYFPFYLPTDAVNVKLTYSDLTADDRTVLELNGIPIGTAGYSTGLGSMTFTDGGPNVAYEFNGQFTSGSVAAGFIPGAPNLLQAIINNTRAGINGVPQNISDSDGTDFGVSGTITYSLIPEPASFLSVFAGLIPFITRRKRAASRV